MFKNTLIVVGPGGVGKGPLAGLTRDGVVAIDPYRLREHGPRKDSDDPLYAPPRLRAELRAVLASFGDSPCSIPCEEEAVEWCPGGRVLFFTVRGEWQCLILQGLEGEIAKAELYAPVLPAVLGIDGIGQALGTIHILVLNPSPTPLAQMSDWDDLRDRTQRNCSERGDPERSVARRVDSIATEAPAWRELISKWDACELTDWQFAEYRFAREGKSLLRDALRAILARSPWLGIFFKDEDEV